MTPAEHDLHQAIDTARHAPMFAAPDVATTSARRAAWQHRWPWLVIAALVAAAPCIGWALRWLARAH